MLGVGVMGFAMPTAQNRTEQIRNHGGRLLQNRNGFPPLRSNHDYYPSKGRTRYQPSNITFRSTPTNCLKGIAEEKTNLESYQEGKSNFRTRHSRTGPRNQQICRVFVYTVASVTTAKRDCVLGKWLGARSWSNVGQKSTRVKCTSSDSISDLGQYVGL